MISALAFFGLALVVIAGLVMLVQDRIRQRAAALDRRLEDLRGTRPGQLAPVTLEELRSMGPFLLRAGVQVSRERLVQAAAGLGVLALAALLLQGPVLALVIVLTIPAIVYFWLRARARKRTEQLIEGLPHYIDGVRQLLAIGNSPAQAIVRALVDAPESVRRFFEPTARRIELGAAVDDALDQLADALKVPEVSMLAAAIRTQMRFGGAITIVLANLAQLLRDRNGIRRDLKSATSEARMSAKVLIAMPLITMGILVLSNPEYPRFFLYDPRGQDLAMVAIALQIAGIFVVRRQMELEF